VSRHAAHWLLACALAFGLALALAPARTASAQASTDVAPLQFHDAAEEARFHALTSVLRCVMCQNQSLADSNAQIAHDLRREVLQLMRQGKSDDEVVAFLVARYGEFVRYKPAVEPATWLLWFGPALLLLGGGIVVARIVRARSRRDVPAPSEDQEW
jgi:cytochrome c-type biogenesis protein CcmH